MFVIPNTEKSLGFESLEGGSVDKLLAAQVRDSEFESLKPVLMLMHMSVIPAVLGSHEK